MPSTLGTEWFDIDDRIKLSSTIRDEETAGSPLIDPDELQVTIVEPDGTSTPYLLSDGDQVIRESLGVYKLYWTARQSGLHWVAFVASGNVGSAEEFGFKVAVPKVPR
jgi:hypothetical protein